MKQENSMKQENYILYQFYIKIVINTSRKFCLWGIVHDLHSAKIGALYKSPGYRDVQTIRFSTYHNGDLVT